MIWILLFFLCIFTIFTYYYFQCNLFSPSFLFNTGFLVASVVAALNSQVWGVDLSFITITVILIANISFFIGSCFGERIRIKTACCSYNKMNNTQVTTGFEVIHVKKTKLIIIIFFGIITLAFQFTEVNRIASSAISFYQNIGLMASYKAALADNDVNDLLKQMLRLFSVLTQILTFVFVYNFKFGGKKSRHIFLNLIIFSEYIVQCLLQGGRGSLINFFIYILFLIYYTNLLQGKSIKKHKKIGFLFIIGSSIATILFLIVFYLGMGLVGRTSDSNFFAYMSSYIGSSIEMLDLYLKSPGNIDKPFLGETMPVFINFFRSLVLLTGDSIKVTLEYRTTPTGLIIGNVYTALRRYYNDLGWGGIVFFPFIMAIFYSVFFRKIKTQQLDSPQSIFNIVVYGTLLGCVILQGMEDSFFLYKVTPGYLFELLIIRMIIPLVVEKRTKFIGNYSFIEEKR